MRSFIGMTSRYFKHLVFARSVKGLDFIVEELGEDLSSELANRKLVDKIDAASSVCEGIIGSTFGSIRDSVD